MNEANRAVREAARDIVVEILAPVESNHKRWMCSSGRGRREPPSNSA